MRRVSLHGVVALALVASGCIGGGSANTAALRSPKSTNTALVVSFTMTKLGQSPVKQTYRIFCADMGTGDASVTFVCSRLTGVFRYRYFAIPSGDCRVRGA
jgi:hypothetical protein